MSDTPNLLVTLIGGCSHPLNELAEKIGNVLSDAGLNVTVEPPTQHSDEWEYGWDGFTSEERATVRLEEVLATTRSEEIQVRCADLEERRWLMLLHGVNVGLERLGLGGMVEVRYDSGQIQKGCDRYDPDFITFEVRRK